MGRTPFKFKQFTVSHEVSSMPIGVDAVLLGCWADVNATKRILDVGTGCGVIALICAQRAKSAHVHGIDTDISSIQEAKTNFASSPWADRITASKMSWGDLQDEKYDLIISNPPYFKSGVTDLKSVRLKARHIGTLSPETLLKESPKYLEDKGRLAMVFPIRNLKDVISYCPSSMKITDLLIIRGRKDVSPKRILMEFTYFPDGNEVGNEIHVSSILQRIYNREWEKIEQDNPLTLLTLEESIGVPTDRHRLLCRDFYLKF